MPTTPDETAQAAALAAEEEAKRAAAADPSPLGDAVTATVDGALSIVEGAAELVGGLLGGLADI